MLRTLSFIFISGLALLLGILVAVPAYQKNKDFARVTVGSATLLAEVASDPLTRTKGLGGRDSIVHGSGMLFVFDHPDRYAFWMKDMRFPIDMIWIKDGAVVYFVEHAPAPFPGTPAILLPTYQPDVAADAVLETRAGFVAEQNLKIGDPVYINDKDLNYSVAPPPPGYDYYIETLRHQKPQGKNFKIEKEISETDAYKKYAIFYNSDNLAISGIMNVPKGIPPTGGFPVLILNHGLIRPEIYFSGRGSKREQDFFPRHGYVIIHPDYRGLASSSPNPFLHHDFYVGNTQDVMSLLDAIEQAHLPLMDLDRIGMWGHSMGGGMAARVMVLRPEIKAYVLFAPISADVEDDFYELSQDEVGWLREMYGPAGSEVYKKISPLNYFEYVQAPVQIHHGTGDTAVPIEFSQKMFDELSRLGKKVEFYAYPKEPHEFIDSWPTASNRALQFFDKYVKE